MYRGQSNLLQMLFSLLCIAAVSLPLDGAGVQTPTFTPCSNDQKIWLSDVTVEDATIGRTMTVNFTLTATEELANEPEIELVVTRENGKKISCPQRGGSCVFKLCGGTSNAERFLGQMWNNECPVPVMKRRETTSSQLNPMIQFVIGRAPTTISVQHKVRSGGAIVGCQAFQVRIEAP